MNLMRLKTIDLAREVGISTQAVRDYERLGVLPPVERLPNGYRRYIRRHLDALCTVRALRVAGYTNGQIRQVMQAVHSDRLDNALAIVDARHAALNEQRRQVDQALQAIRELVSVRDEPADRRSRRTAQIGVAAAAVGVRPSALRFWEQEGLLHPARDRSSGFRAYDEFQMRLVNLVALLRQIDYSFDAIRAVVGTIMETGQVRTIDTLATRRHDIFEASKACSAATSALWNYAGGSEME
jgi:DNA-binding transcriptional MerR regulator